MVASNSACSRLALVRSAWARLTRVPQPSPEAPSNVAPARFAPAKFALVRFVSLNSSFQRSHFRDRLHSNSPAYKTGLLTMMRPWSQGPPPDPEMHTGRHPALVPTAHSCGLVGREEAGTPSTFEALKPWRLASANCGPATCTCLSTASSKPRPRHGPPRRPALSGAPGHGQRWQREAALEELAAPHRGGPQVQRPRRADPGREPRCEDGDYDGEVLSTSSSTSIGSSSPTAAEIVHDVSRLHSVSEGLVEQNPIVGSSLRTWESRRPEAAWVRLL